MSIVFLNGDFIEETEAKISVTDRGFLFGDGVFTTIRVDEGKIECFDLHLKRLKEHCAVLRIEFPDLLKRSLVEKLLMLNGAHRGVWRLKMMITGGERRSPSQLRPYSQVVMAIKPYENHFSPQVLVSYPQPLSSPLSHIKSLSYLDRFYVSNYANLKGAHDVILTDSNGWVTETAFSNLFWCIGDTLMTPDPELPLLFGITIQLILNAALEMNMKTEVVKTKLAELPVEANFFLSNCLKGICPIISVDGKSFPYNEILHRNLDKMYKNEVRKYC